MEQPKVPESYKQELLGILRRGPVTPIAPLADNWLEHENAIANALSRRVKLGEVAGYMNISKSPTLSNIINAATVKKG